MDMESCQQIKSTRDTLSALTEIEEAIEATEDSIETHELIWVRDILREHLAKGGHATPLQ